MFPIFAKSSVFQAAKLANFDGFLKFALFGLKLNPNHFFLSEGLRVQTK